MNVGTNMGINKEGKSDRQVDYCRVEVKIYM